MTIALESLRSLHSGSSIDNPIIEQKLCRVC